MKFLFLIPPSEAKNPGGDIGMEKLTYVFRKPIQIARKATMNDLKCQGHRYVQAGILNNSISCGPFMTAIERYSGVMYQAINYQNMSTTGKEYFDEHIAILSGMYGLVRPQDSIANYKLPAECRGLSIFWRKSLTTTLSDLKDYTHIVNLLPISYRKMINFSGLKIPIIHVEFNEHLEMHRKKLTHGIKKIRGEFIRRICEQTASALQNFPGVHDKHSNEIYITIIPSEEGYL